MKKLTNGSFGRTIRGHTDEIERPLSDGALEKDDVALCGLKEIILNNI